MTAADQATIAETTNGRIRGIDTGGVWVFKGMRYADSTAGANRFRPPQPPRQWAGIIDAVQWGPSAPQLPVPGHHDPFYAWYGAIQPISEDCLFLNIFTPGVGSGRRPVMVWIHGGGWREFSGTAPGFDGTALARAQDVVVVTLNHRLGAFGFLRIDGADDRFADSGNAGLLDIAMALAWVRNNAAAFGGDASNVTLFGESGGASKLAALLSMRAAKGLFHKAIIQSSAGGLRLASREDAARQAADLAAALGQPRLDGGALQALPLDALLAALATMRGTFRGAIDDRSFHADPYGETAPAIAADVPVLAGCTHTETTYYLRADTRNFDLDLATVRRRLMRFLGTDAAQTEALLDAYQAGYPVESPSGLLTFVTTDYIFKRNTGRIAALQADLRGAPVYAYLFAHETPVDGGRMRSPHTSEVPFIFGTTAAAAAQVGDGPDLAPLTATMMATWAAFARSGNPNNPALPRWVPFSAADPQVMVLDRDSRLALDPGGQTRSALEGLPYFGYGHAIPAVVAD